MRVFLTAVAVFLLDMGSKYLAQRLIAPDDRIPLIHGVFYLTLVRNPGAAFGILAYRTNFFILITVVVVVLLIYYSRHYAGAHPLWPVAIGLQLGGAVGNLIDRLRYGRVVDFLEFPFWPVFNLADAALVTGVGLFVLLLWLTPSTPAPPGRQGDG